MASDDSTFDFTDNSHRRYNPLTDTWVLVSPHRAKRPWLGQQEAPSKLEIAEYDESCYLCPRNLRATGSKNPNYGSTFIFPNDYAAVKLNQPGLSQGRGNDSERDQLFKTSSVEGNCYVICFSPKHNLTLPLMMHKEIVRVVEAWISLYRQLEEEANQGKPFKYVQIFENKGTAMGCSNLHPHGQAWCLSTVPNELMKEFTSFKKFQDSFSKHMLDSYMEIELSERERVVVENDSFVVLVPFWAIWPFETLVVSKTHLPSLKEFNAKQQSDLAAILKNLTTKYDNLFSTSFPYSMGTHQAPLNASEEEKKISWFHMHFYPPLLRSATVRKFLVGFELLGEPQRDLTAEQAAERLRTLDGITHYSENLD
ncbi:LAMI_0H20054g1_1 [Lachancea mirantina]|uniref:Galactose-1-phosphate uridylyltransferase n=1 Tax=Lachancea mirantina TaxID=1230905 RepID=A0A1G4KK25_9SACH|nr:LAMI_0H20054g1_1 [Lachancea mirantina]